MNANDLLSEVLHALTEHGTVGHVVTKGFGGGLTVPSWNGCGPDCPGCRAERERIDHLRRMERVIATVPMDTLTVEQFRKLTQGK